ncbi:Protein of unknown function, DUF600 [Marininema mesophilum]|uniref:Uncharacterized protein n=1 Tax=Marininema mesophilum TaxID=1048340 RepID=A0A1H2YIG6_9BACL|nr:immunity protein YezG family protein [Marininema mesophilum]SDX05003.1 Protein of unknown function, DUF600 [Marininema mesophilum]
MIEEKLGVLYPKIIETVIEIIPEEWQKIYIHRAAMEGYQSGFFITSLLPKISQFIV